MRLRSILLSAAIWLAAGCATGPCRYLEANAMSKPKTENSGSGSSASVPSPAGTSAAEASGGARVWVGKADGSRQCEPRSGVAIEEMAKELAGLTIFARRSGHDGRMRAQMCGLPTGRMHLFEISSQDLEAALKKGFVREEKAQ